MPGQVLAYGYGYFRNRFRIVRKANAELRREITECEQAEEAPRRNLEQLARVSRAASMGELTTSIALPDTVPRRMHRRKNSWLLAMWPRRIV